MSILFSPPYCRYSREDLKSPSGQSSEEPGAQVSSWVHGTARVESERAGNDNDQEADDDGLQASGDPQVSGVKDGKDNQKEEHGGHHLDREKMVPSFSLCSAHSQSPVLFGDGNDKDLKTQSQHSS